MKISVRVRPHSRRRGVEQIEEGRYLVSVSAPPVEGKANEEVIELLAEYFGKHRRDITILTGRGGRNKIIRVD